MPTNIHYSFVSFLFLWSILIYICVQCIFGVCVSTRDYRSEQVSTFNFFFFYIYYVCV